MLYIENFSSHINEEVFMASIEQSCDHVALVGRCGRYIYANKSYCDNCGYSKDYILGKRSNLLKSGKLDNKFYSKLWLRLLDRKIVDATFINKRKDTTLYYDHQVITPIIIDNMVKCFLVVGRDVEEKFEKESKLVDMAMRDSLTGLFNRYAFDKFIKDLKTKEVVLVLCDIDYFKKVNDTYGHEIGDSLLQELSNIFINSLRKKDAVFRWGGEEFILIIDANMDDSIKVIEKIRKKIEINTFCNNIQITCSFGVAELNSLDVKNSIKIADDKLYKSKNDGRNCINF